MRYLLHGLMLTAVISLALSSLSMADELTWKDCIRETAQNHPDLISAQAVIKKSQASRDITRSGLFPSLDANVDAARAKSSGSTHNSFSYGLNGSLLLFDGGQKLFDTFAADENIKLSQEKYRYASTQVRYRLRKAFVELMRAQTIIGVSEEIVTIRKNNLNLISLRYDSGLEHKGARLTAEANLAQAEFNLAQAKRNLEFAQRQLSQEMGRDTFVPMVVANDWNIADRVAEKPDFEQLVKNNPYWLQQIAQENISSLGVKSAYGNFSPTISASAGAGKTGSRWPPEKNDWDAGLSLSLPLFEGGANVAKLAQAKATLQETQANRRGIRDQLIIALAQYWADFQDAVDLVDVKQKILLAAQERAKISEAQYSDGFITYDNWSIIEDNLVQSKTAFVDAQANALLAEAAWIQAKGDTLEYAQK